MTVVGKTRYLNKIREELKLKKELAQVYLIVYGFLLPHILNVVSDSSNVEAQKYMVVFLLMFVFSIFTYYLEITKIYDLTVLSLPAVNTIALFTAMSFSFTLALYVVLYAKAAINTEYANPFIVYLAEGTLLSLVTVRSLTVKPEFLKC